MNDQNRLEAMHDTSSRQYSGWGFIAVPLSPAYMLYFVPTRIHILYEVYLYIYILQININSRNSDPGSHIAGKDVGCRSNFDPSRPLYTQDTSFSVKSSLTAVCQGVQTLSTDIFDY